MKNHIPIIIFVIILIIVVLVSVLIVVTNYEKNRPINPNVSLENLTENDFNKIKEKYEDERKKQEFLKLCNDIELAVTNRLLDGTVTNDDELKLAIDKINTILKSNNWESLGLEYPAYWMGNWKLNNEGKLSFTFTYKEIMPSWSMSDKEASRYIK